MISLSNIPAGRLLGGSVSQGKKPSKLAMLAAKRRAQEKEKCTADTTSAPTMETARDALWRLQNAQKHTPPASLGCSAAVAKEYAVGEGRTSTRTSNKEDEARQQPVFKSPDVSQKDSVLCENLRAEPTRFGAMLTENRTSPHLATDVVFNNMPTKSFDFQSPSPDDVVRKAQSKGPKWAVDTSKH